MIAEALPLRGRTSPNWNPWKPVRATSVGFVLDDNETKNYITLVQSVSAEQILGRITIPREAIKKIRKRQ